MKKLSALIALTLLTAPAAYAQDGSSCANAITLHSMQSVDSDTTGDPNWIASYGPLVSPSNDRMYTFTISNGGTGPLTPTASNYQFAMYVLSGCIAGSEGAPIGSTGTLNQGIDLSGITSDGNQYWLAVTGTAAGGPTANGTLTFTTGTLPVTLQSFEVN